MGERGPGSGRSDVGRSRWFGLPRMALLFVASTALLVAWGTTADLCDLRLRTLAPRVVWLAALGLLGASVYVGLNTSEVRGRLKIVPLGATLVLIALFLLEVFVFLVLNFNDAGFCSSGIE